MTGGTTFRNPHNLPVKDDQIWELCRMTRDGRFRHFACFSNLLDVSWCILGLLVVFEDGALILLYLKLWAAWEDCVVCGRPFTWRKKPGPQDVDFQNDSKGPCNDWRLKLLRSSFTWMVSSRFGLGGFLSRAMGATSLVYLEGAPGQCERQPRHNSNNHSTEDFNYKTA